MNLTYVVMVLCGQSFRTIGSDTTDGFIYILYVFGMGYRVIVIERL